MSGLKREPNELVNWRRSPAGAQGTNSGHKNAEGMATVGVHVELTVRLRLGVSHRNTRRMRLNELGRYKGNVGYFCQDAGECPRFLEFS